MLPDIYIRVEFKDGVRNGAGVLNLPGGRKIVGVWEKTK